MNRRSLFSRLIGGIFGLPIISKIVPRSKTHNETDIQAFAMATKDDGTKVEIPLRVDEVNGGFAAYRNLKYTCTVTHVKIIKDGEETIIPIFGYI